MQSDFYVLLIEYYLFEQYIFICINLFVLLNGIALSTL